MTKSLDQEQAAKVSERPRFERKIQCLQTFSHFGWAIKRVSGCAPITDQNRRFMARTQNTELCPANKALRTISDVVRAFLRLKRWAIFSCLSGTVAFPSGLTWI